MYLVGNRSGHARAFKSLVAHWAGWERARVEYSRIRVPVQLVYGERDWSRPEEREANRRDIPGARLRVVEGAGHFLSLDDPSSAVRAIVEPEI
jgi:pimeloyl-ACP methyl ester carboxylesterase